MNFHPAFSTEFSSAIPDGGPAAGPVLLGDVIQIPLADEGSRLDGFIHWVEASGFAGVAALAGVFILASMVMVPNTPLVMAAGWIWGLWQGVATIMAAIFLASTLGYWISQKLGRKWLLKRYGDRPKFTAVDEAVSKEGAKVIFLLRLAPVFPYGFSNYVYGLTGVRYLSYIAATLAGLVPMTLLYAYLGTLKRAGAESPEAIRRMALGLGFVALLGGFWFLGKICRKALRSAAAADPGDSSPAEGSTSG